MNTYDHQAIEKKWQKKWKEIDQNRTENSVEGKDNEYLLVEFPYPSGNLHVGHWYAFAVPDIYARMRRMQGKNVLYPIGFDAFGLPAENAAIKRGLDPREWTESNMATMLEQLESMGNSFDWSRMVHTCDPEYYTWTQWLFLQLYKKGLAERKTSTVNWDPVDKTVLANEQVLPDGTAERSGAKVEKKELEQWFFKITEYADRLLSDLEELDWPEDIKQAQREWIGKSEGSEISFLVTGRLVAGTYSVDVFTTRADTLFGVTYVVLAPEHSLLDTLKDSVENWEEVDAYRTQAMQKKDLDRQQSNEKTGVEVKGVYAINPANNEKVPVWVADYVLGGYGTGAVMAVPAHDERDFQFAQKYNLSVRQVVLYPDKNTHTYRAITKGGGVSVAPWFPEMYQITENASGKIVGFLLKNLGKECYVEKGFLLNSAEFDGMSSQDAKVAITKHVGGKMTTQYRIRDWLLSRQRYWGCPIPIVYDPEGNPHAVPEEHLPWLLPQDVDFTPTGEAPLARSAELQQRTEEIFGKGWTPEVDTMDTFVDSSWYFLRYLDPKNEKEFASREAQDAWMPIARYSGGAEHTTMHLLYSRFFHKALFDLGLVKDKEPYVSRMNRGLVLGPDGQKMSKSKGNVIDPGEHVERVGADTVKMYLAFVGPYNEVGQYPWDLGGIAGIRRFLERVHRLRRRVVPSIDGTIDDTIERALHQTIKKVTDDALQYKFNTAISAMMVLVNALEKEKDVPAEVYSTLLRLLAPFAPHLTEELWEDTGHATSIHIESWPEYDESKLEGDTMQIVVQVNGKTRGTIEISRSTAEADIIAQAKTHEAVARHLEGKEVKKEIYVKGRLVNVVV